MENPSVEIGPFADNFTLKLSIIQLINSTTHFDTLNIFKYSMIPLCSIIAIIFIGYKITSEIPAFSIKIWLVYWR